MLAKLLLLSGGVLGLICQLAGLVSALIALGPVMDGGATPLAVLTGGCVLLLLVHEAGHLLACVALGVQVTGVYLGWNKHAVRFRLRGVQVSLGMPNGGRVEHVLAGSSKRAAVIGAAGPAANLAVAAVLLAIQVALPAGTTARDVLLALAALSAAMGVGNLMPFRTRSGHLSDGARLLTLGNEKLARALRVRTVARFIAPDEKAWKVTPSRC